MVSGGNAPIVACCPYSYFCTSNQVPEMIVLIVKIGLANIVKLLRLLSIIEDTVCAKNRSITTGNGYWQKLRNNRKITQNLKNELARWGLCK